jgi:hypothetical protein
VYLVCWRNHIRHDYVKSVWSHLYVFMFGSENCSWMFWFSQRISRTFCCRKKVRFWFWSLDSDNLEGVCCLPALLLLSSHCPLVATTPCQVFCLHVMLLFCFTLKRNVLCKSNLVFCFTQLDFVVGEHLKHHQGQYSVGVKWSLSTLCQSTSS